MIEWLIDSYLQRWWFHPAFTSLYQQLNMFSFFSWNLVETAFNNQHLVKSLNITYGFHVERFWDFFLYDIMVIWSCYLESPQQRCQESKHFLFCSVLEAQDGDQVFESENKQTNKRFTKHSFIVWKINQLYPLLFNSCSPILINLRQMLILRNNIVFC